MTRRDWRESPLLPRNFPSQIGLCLFHFLLKTDSLFFSPTRTQISASEQASPLSQNVETGVENTLLIADQRKGDEMASDFETGFEDSQDYTREGLWLWVWPYVETGFTGRDTLSLMSHAPGQESGQPVVNSEYSLNHASRRGFGVQCKKREIEHLWTGRCLRQGLGPRK